MLRLRSVLHLALIGACLMLLIVPEILGKVKPKKEKSKDKGKSKDSGSADGRIAKIMKEQPVLDAHNDLPFNLRNHYFNELEKFDMNSDLRKNKEWMSILSKETHTDIPRMKKGGVGIQFWAAFTKCESQYKDSVEQTLEQIDVINRFINKHKKHLQYAQSTTGIKDALKNGKIASLIGVEGGHSIQSSLGILRTLYDLGARYLTLTHSCNTPWADSSVVNNATGDQEAINGGLSEFGLKVVAEMNRIGMIVDLSHTSVETQKMALEHSKAPIIYSHSGSFAICDHHRNVHDEVLELVKEKKGVVMVNFYSEFVKCDGTRATIEDVVEHIEHIREIAGVESLGFGSDFDGVDVLPEGLDDVSKYPGLLKALIETGRWSDADLKKICGQNFLRVFAEVEAVRKSLKNTPPDDEAISREELEKKNADMTAITAKFPGDPLPQSNFK